VSFTFSLIGGIRARAKRDDSRSAAPSRHLIVRQAPLGKAKSELLDRNRLLLPFSSLERDFCRRRLARQKGPEDDLSARRPGIGDHHTREMAAKAAFLPASCHLRVSGDWVVGEPGLEPGTH
jgi:hypothetical protein